MFSTHRPAPHADHFSLSPNDLLTLTPAQPTALHVRSGVLWVTQAGDDRDHFLKAGQSMELAPHRLTVLQAQVGQVQASLAPMVDDRSMKRSWRLLPKPWRANTQFST